MRVQMSYKVLVFILNFIAGECQLLGSSFHSQTSKMQLTSGSQLPFYSCKFDVNVDCIWKVNGTTVSVSSYDYTWVTGNGTNTRDCSIVGKSHSTPKLNRNNNKANVTCIGYLIGSIKKYVELGDSIRLNCSFSERRHCSWKRNDQIINIEGRYKYIQQHGDSKGPDCSIEIGDIQQIDLTTWLCLVQATDDESKRNLSVYYTLHINITSELTSAESQRPKDVLTPSIKDLLPSTTDSPTSSGVPQVSPPKIIYTALGVTGTLAVILAVAVVYQYRRQKLRRNQEPPDEPKHNTTSSTVIKEDFMKPENPSNTEDLEPTYMNVTQPHLTPLPPPEVPQPEQPISTSTPRPRSNIVDDDIQATEVIYKQVVISRKSMASLTREVPHIHIGDVAYATILQKRLSQDFSRL